MSALRHFLTSGQIAAKAGRFACIGLLSGSIYAAVTAFCVLLGTAPVPASIAGYCASVPASFLGHRSFSFRSRGRWTFEALRFALAQVLNICVTAGSMHAVVAWLGGPYWWGMIAAVIFVPAANFAFMNLWVFRKQPARMETAR